MHSTAPTYLLHSSNGAYTNTGEYARSDGDALSGVAVPNICINLKTVDASSIAS